MCPLKKRLIPANKQKVLVVFTGGHSIVIHFPKASELGCLIKT